MCLNIHIVFHYEETQVQSAICDLNNKIKNSKEVKVYHEEEKSDVLNEEKNELDRDSKLAKCKHQISSFNFNWMEFSIFNII